MQAGFHLPVCVVMQYISHMENMTKQIDRHVIMMRFEFSMYTLGNGYELRVSPYTLGQ